MIKVFEEMVQGSEEWLMIRCGLLTASEMERIITPKKLQYSQSEKQRTHLYELAAQRVTQYVEPSYISDAMLRGQTDESYARGEYDENYAEVTQVGFMTNDKWGFTLGYSPDGLVGDEGQIEAKSRCQKYQMQTILTKEIPEEFIIQIQTGLLISERKWCDFISYCGGMHMITLRAYSDEKIHAAIAEAAASFHLELDKAVKGYQSVVDDIGIRTIYTERRTEQEITL